VRRFLREFLSDKRVVEAPALPWRVCLELCILPIRSRRSAAKYSQVWYPEGSPILVHTRAQADALQADLGEHFAVRAAMRYGEPSISAELDSLAQAGVSQVLILPMYPQFSGTTVATIYDAVAQHYRSRRDQPELRFVRSFPTDPNYIEALAQRIEATWAAASRPDFAAGDKLILSFHGIPQSMVRAGDPYHGECQATAAALRARLGLEEAQCLTTFQSKFGPSPWLEPATIDTVTAAGQAGAGRIDVVCPGFTADCLETLEEIDLLNREAFTQAGGGRFVRIPCLNAEKPWIASLSALVRRQTTDWIAAR
jgi:ferrochelatase